MGRCANSASVSTRLTPRSRGVNACRSPAPRRWPASRGSCCSTRSRPSSIPAPAATSSTRSPRSAAPAARCSWQPTSSPRSATRLTACSCSTMARCNSTRPPPTCSSASPACKTPSFTSPRRARSGVLRLYFIFLRDALRLTALSAAAYVLLAAALLRFGASAAALQIPLLQVALFGLLFLSRRYAGRNIEWILGLAQRKRALAWYNFALNLSHLAMISSATALVLFAIDSLSADSGWHPPFVLQPARLLDLPELHGRALAFALFILTAALFSCWTISRPPTASNFARRQRFLLLGWVTVASLFTY